jgi:hypothetical protein
MTLCSTEAPAWPHLCAAPMYAPMQDHHTTLCYTQIVAPPHIHCHCLGMQINCLTLVRCCCGWSGQTSWPTTTIRNVWCLRLMDCTTLPLPNPLKLYQRVITWLISANSYHMTRHMTSSRPSWADGGHMYVLLLSYVLYCSWWTASLIVTSLTSVDSYWLIQSYCCTMVIVSIHIVLPHLLFSHLVLPLPVWAT